MVSCGWVSLVAVATAWMSSIQAKTYIGKRDLDRDYYTLYVPTEASAQYIANKLQVRYEGQVGELENWYMLSSPKAKKTKRTKDSNDEDKVLSDFKHYKESFLMKRQDESLGRHWQQAKELNKQELKKRTKRAPVTTLVEKTQRELDIKDPWFFQQWHLINQVNPGNDINVTGVWSQGITGKGVNVAILDDGVDYQSKDLADNFFAEGSYDFNDHEDLPTPKLWDDNHGTRCAGQIAAVKNDVCGMGIAYEAKVAGVRILSGELTDADEALALNYNYQQNHIFSCSWGPPDNGQTMEAPNGILADAFRNGIEKGRGGKGSIYVFATGNGANFGDNCNFDGYTNSIYTITVGAIDHNNDHPSYSESCSAQLVVTYSSGGGEYIHTTDRGENSCSDRHGGTSAAAPNAVGIFALVLSVRPDLTWRDLQHLCVQTAIPVKLDDEDWKTLPSGRIYNHKFGYGKLDAYRLIEAAKTFESVNQQTWLELASPVKRRDIPDSTGLKTSKALKSTVVVTEDMIKAAGLLRLEHITATVNLMHQKRGNVVIDLESPNQVISHLATRRDADTDSHGMKNWKFMTVKHWEENPLGNWTLSIYDVDNPESTGYLLNWTLTLFGEQDPSFEGTPIHNSEDVIHQDDHVPVSSSTLKIMTSTKDDTPSRPTRIKPNTTSNVNEATTTESMSSEGTDVFYSSDARDNRAFFIILGTVIGIAGIVLAGIVLIRLYQKRASNRYEKQFGGYEFDMIQPLTELNEHELSESDEDEEDQLVRK